MTHSFFFQDQWLCVGTSTQVLSSGERKQQCKAYLRTRTTCNSGTEHHSNPILSQDHTMVIPLLTRKPAQLVSYDSVMCGSTPSPRTAWLSWQGSIGKNVLYATESKLNCKGSASLWWPYKGKSLRSGRWAAKTQQWVYWEATRAWQDTAGIMSRSLRPDVDGLWLD
jgi:hypothetical protein